MPPPKGKQATKGQKQIVEDNKGTIKFYSLMAIGAMLIYLPVAFIFFWDQFNWKDWGLTFFAGTVYSGSLSLMKYMARPIYSRESGALLDGGTDLNLENGFAENLKDLIILTSTIQLLSLISNYFWFLWLFAPGRAMYLLWVNILGPWFFQEAPPEPDEKKQKKMERQRMRRM